MNSDTKDILEKEHGWKINDRPNLGKCIHGVSGVCISCLEKHCFELESRVERLEKELYQSSLHDTSKPEPEQKSLEKIIKERLGCHDKRGQLWDSNLTVFDGKFAIVEQTRINNLVEQIREYIKKELRKKCPVHVGWLYLIKQVEETIDKC